jgi:hypothetical protein
LVVVGRRVQLPPLGRLVATLGLAVILVDRAEGLVGRPAPLGVVVQAAILALVAWVAAKPRVIRFKMGFLEMAVVVVAVAAVLVADPAAVAVVEQVFMVRVRMEPEERRQIVLPMAAMAAQVVLLAKRGLMETLLIMAGVVVVTAAAPALALGLGWAALAAKAETELSA